MRKNMKIMAAGFMAASLMLSGFGTGNAAYAADNGTGSAGALLDSQYTLEEMLMYAIEDEYLAKTEYDLIIEEYGVQRPFSNITKAEATHISWLVPLFEKYDIAVPQSDWKKMTAVPESLEVAYKTGVEAEVRNIAMYENFLKEDLSADVRLVFEKLMNASKNHLRAFQNAADGNNAGMNLNNGKTGNSGRPGNSGKSGNSGSGLNQADRGNMNNYNGNCIIQ